MSNSIRCKMYVHAINYGKNVQPDGSETRSCSVTMQAVHGKTVNEKGEFQSYEQTCDENTLFGKWTPSGNLTMFIVNPAAVDQLEIGAEYYIDIHRAPDTPHACHRDPTHPTEVDRVKKLLADGAGAGPLGGD